MPNNCERRGLSYEGDRRRGLMNGNALPTHDFIHPSIHPSPQVVSPSGAAGGDTPSRYHALAVAYYRTTLIDEVVSSVVIVLDGRAPILPLLLLMLLRCRPAVLHRSSTSYYAALLNNERQLALALSLCFSS